MRTIVKMLLCMCLLFSQMTPFTPLTAKLSNMVNSTSNKEGESVDNSVVPSTEISAEDAEKSKYAAIASNFITLDMEGYCTLNVPLSHFTVNDGNSTPTYKQIDYNDNKTRVYMSYITNMDKTADIPGYITKEVAKVDTVTNDKTEKKYCSYDWVRIKADHQEDDCNIYVYYTLNKDKTSAFWLKVKVDTNTDDNKFDDIMTQMLNTYSLYAVSGSIFQTPTTGYYANNNTKDNTVANTSDYQANSSSNEVFNSRGGYVLGADISDDWKDLEIIIDGTKFKLPASMQDIKNAGFTLNDATVTSDNDMMVYKSNTKTLSYQNNNGTVIQVTVKNDDMQGNKKFDDCQVVAITVDASKLVDKVATNENETYNDETAKDEWAARNAKDKNNHELILPGGITWGVYTDDLRSYYGTCIQTNYDTGIPSLTWKSGNKQMLIRTGAVHGIVYVKLQCTETSN